MEISLLFGSFNVCQINLFQLTEPRNETCLYIKYSLAIFIFLPCFFFSKNTDRAIRKVQRETSFPCMRHYGYNDSKCVQNSKIPSPYKNISFITDSAAEVRAIYGGKVCRVFTIENDYAVVTNFGSYFITYYPLKKPGLKKGDTIIQGQPVSKVGYLDNACEINILISKDKKFIDPRTWFRW